MKERPILFSGPMVRAILEGRKTQTRRAVKPAVASALDYYGSEDIPPVVQFGETGHSGPGWYVHSEEYPDEGSSHVLCPYGAPGDRLWVREAWQQVIRRRVTSEEAWWPGRQEWPGIGSRPYWPSKFNGDNHVIIHRADGEMPGGFPERWRPSIHMPRWACRLVLEVTGVRVERLQDISEVDAAREGIPVRNPRDLSEDYGDGEYLLRGFADLWASINGADSWAANPWVWVLSFKRLEAKTEAA